MEETFLGERKSSEQEVATVKKLSLKHKNPMKATSGEIYRSSEIFNQQIHRKRYKRKIKCC
jgi:hypothetical protein